MTEAFDEAHRSVWPELLGELEDISIAEYSNFRHGQQRFLYMRLPDFHHLLACLSASEVDQRWQEAMAALFEPVPGAEGLSAQRWPATASTANRRLQQASRLD